MDWTRYKALCDAPDVWSRWFIERLIEVRSDPALAAILDGTPLPQPADHRGGRETEMFRISLDAQTLARVQNSVYEAQATNVLPPALQRRGLGGFTEALLEYEQWLATAVRGAPPVELGPSDGALANALSDAPSTMQAGDAARAPSSPRPAGMRAKDRQTTDITTARENPMGQAGETVLGMIDAFNRNHLDDILSFFAEDAVYHNMPMAPLTGTEAIRAGLSGFLGEATKVEWVVLNLLEDSAGTVLTERVDKFEVNGQWIELPVMGTFEVRSGRIQAWRDYFDLSDFQRQMAAAQGQA